jgi:hypothetical protein
MIPLVACAKAFGVRPSSFIQGIGGYEAWCFDVAATIYLTEMSKSAEEEEVDAETFL